MPSTGHPPRQTVDVEAQTVGAPDPVVERARRRVGTRLRNKWRLDAVLGIGGMATVYAATHRNGGRAAVKILHPELCLNAEALRRFLHEGSAANSVDHDGCVHVIDDDTAEDGAPYLVTELLRGETLEDRRVRLGGRLEEDDVFAVADQLLSVLAAAHDKGVIHRDLKPDNIFLTQTGQVKVLDFGIARLCQMSAEPGNATRTGVLMGTPAFMPPEQARGLWPQVDGQSDLWATGATMFCVLSGRPVHDGRTSNEVLLSAMTVAAPPLASVASSVTPLLAQVVDRALAFDKAHRWPTARGMQEALRAAYTANHSAPMAAAPPLEVAESVMAPTIASGMTTARPIAGSIPAPPMPSSRPRVKIAIAAVTGACAAGLLAHSAVRARSQETEPSTAAAHAPSAVSALLPAPAPSARPAPAEQAQAQPTTSGADSVPVSALPVAPRAAIVAPAAGPVKPASPAAHAAVPRSTSPAAPTVTPPSKGDCVPPYVLDPSTGKKKWRPECL